MAGPAAKSTTASALRAHLDARAAKARKNPVEFLEFAIREEFTRQPLKCAPHQRLLFDFALAHPRCVIRAPVGSSKTYTLATLTLWLLGQDETARGAVISATQELAKKQLGMVRDMIDGTSAEQAAVRATFRRLRRSPREQDPWSATKITVARPPGIRDPSLIAIGVGGALVGARLSWILVDDVLDEENTRTEERRQQTARWFASTVLSRRDASGARIVVLGTPWHPNDLTFSLEKSGWPTLVMTATGDVYVSNTDWAATSGRLRPSLVSPDGAWRLKAHDAMKYIANAPAYVDTDDSVPLWPEKFSSQRIEELRTEYPPFEFNQLFMMRCRDESVARCKIEWIKRCKENARALGITAPLVEYAGSNLTVTGVDLAVGQESRHDFSAIFTVEFLPKFTMPDGTERKNMRRILAAEHGRWQGQEIVNRILAHSRRYKSVIAVENVGGQDFLRQWILAQDASAPVRAFNTNASNKHHRTWGLESMFVEIENAAWLIPNDANERCHPSIERWIEECVYFDPAGHSGDLLMASWIAREQSRRIIRNLWQEQADGTSLSATILAR